MKVLLLSSPDTTQPLFPRISTSPHLGLSMLSAMIQDIAQVRVGDLMVRQSDVPGAIRQAMELCKPDLVGISAITFQYYTARKIAALVRSIDPKVKIALGGFHASMDYHSIALDPEADFDYIVRGEGELTFRELVDCLNRGADCGQIEGLSYRKADGFVHNNPRSLARLEELPLPARDNRIWGGYHILGSPFDNIESSRGCTMPCTFCSITRHYGGLNYRAFPIDRVIEDARNAYKLGTRYLFFVDDNLSLDQKRFGALCDAIIAADLPGLSFSAQGYVAGLYQQEWLLDKIAQARFRMIFLGIENVTSRNLAYYKKGDIVKKTEWVLRALRERGILVMGGFILGSPEDTKADILGQFDFMRRWAIDSYLIQILTPYPGTELTKDLDARGYIVNRDLSRYNGFFANVHTNSLSSRDLEYLKWKHQPYYRDVRWLLSSNAARQYLGKMLLREGLPRTWEFLVEKTRILLRGEDYAFRKFCQKHLNANSFFGETKVPAWPDVPRPSPS
jgi:radical SAM superfamily enzyme YgiQ (UPF0313 family)